MTLNNAKEQHDSKRNRQRIHVAHPFQEVVRDADKHVVQSTQSDLLDCSTDSK